MKRILFLGSHLQSYRCLRFLNEQVEGAEIVGFVPHQSPQIVRADQDAAAYARAAGIPELTLNALDQCDFDLGISLMFDKVLPASVIEKPVYGFINMHLGPLPRFRGSNSVLHAIRLARRDNHWTFGVTIQYLIPKLDSGPIIDVDSFPIFEDDTAYSLHTRACDHIHPLFVRHIRDIVAADGCVPSRPQEGMSYFFRKGDVDHEVRLDASPEEIYDQVRALTFPGKPPAYAMIGGRKFYLTL